MPTCLIGLGSNLADRLATLQSATKQIGENPHIRRLVCSSWHETAPIGGPSGQGAFLNGAARFDSDLSPHALMQLLAAVEASHGRRRRIRWDQRTLDLDLLLYGSHCISCPAVEVPHPRMLSRRFVMEPAVEIGANLVHPLRGTSLSKIQTATRAADSYVAIASPRPQDARHIAAQIAQSNGYHQIVDDIGAEKESSSAEKNDTENFNAKKSYPESGDCRLNENKPSPSADGPDHGITQEIHRLNRRARQITPTSWTKDAPIALSGFWLDESALVADAWLAHPNATNDLRSRWREAWQAAVRRAATPRLVILLDAPDSHEDVPHARRWVRRLFAPSDSAILRVSLHDQQRAIDEVSAAIVSIA